MPPKTRAGKRDEVESDTDNEMDNTMIPTPSSPNISMTENMLQDLVYNITQSQAEANRALIESILANTNGREQAPSTPSVSQYTTSHSARPGNFSKCTSRFDGLTKDADELEAFIDAIEVYRDCTNISEEHALRGLPMLLVGEAAVWWQGVKASIQSWSDAIRQLRGMYGVPRPAYKIFRDIFSCEQNSERADVYISKVRALLAKLPYDVPEIIKLDIVYGLLDRRIRKRVCRDSVDGIELLITKARFVEESLAEVSNLKKSTSVNSNPRPAQERSGTTVNLQTESVNRDSSAKVSPNFSAKPSYSSEGSKRVRPKCGYCKLYGHTIEGCRRIEKKDSMSSKVADSKDSNAQIRCYGCGQPGVVRSKCENCKTVSIGATSTSTPSTSTSDFCTARVEGNDELRPLVEIGVVGHKGVAILDTGATHSIAGPMLYSLLVDANVEFLSTSRTIGLADGSQQVCTALECTVDVNLAGRKIPTLFLVLPKAQTRTLLGRDFLLDAGIRLDLPQSSWSFSDAPRRWHPFVTRFYLPTGGGNEPKKVDASNLMLRDTIGTNLTARQRACRNTLSQQSRTDGADCDLYIAEVLPSRSPRVCENRLKHSGMRRIVKEVTNDPSRGRGWPKGGFVMSDDVLNRSEKSRAKQKRNADESRRPAPDYNPGDRGLLKAQGRNGTASGRLPHTIVTSEDGAFNKYSLNGVEIPKSPKIPDATALKGLDRRKRLADRVIITQHFTESAVTPGGDISMQCAATGDRPPQFVWERDGIVVSSNTDPRYAIGQVMTSDNSVVAQLNITRVRVEDGGLYSCTAREGEHVASHENRLDVYGPPYIRALPSIKMQSGESVNLRCPFYGYPISKIDWEYQGKTLTSNSLFQSRYRRSVHPKRKNRRNAPSVNINGVLSINEVSKEMHTAVYTCVVTSPSGEMARRAFEIQVVEAPVLDELMLANNLQEGQNANIYCNVRNGDLPIHFEWLKDGKRIPSSLRVTERNSELFSALVIKKVSLEHCGTYTCVASNHVAKVNRSTELYIKVAPKWLEEPSNSSLLLGRKGAVSCSASGYPQPQVHWMKKDALLGTWQPVLELSGGGILSLPNGTLVIEQVSHTDEGLYSCNVENSVGQPLSKTVWMSVNKPVHFETASTNVTSRLGHPVILECKPLGDDPIRVTWTHDGSALEFQTQRLKFSETKTIQGVISTINLAYSEINDAGVYQCRANNPYGSASFNVYLTILEPPTPPSDLRIDTVRSRTVSVSWRDTLRAHSRHYSLQYSHTHYSDSWDRATTINVTRKESEVRQSIELQNLRPATSYVVRVATGNQVGTSVYTSPSHFTTHEEAPSSPPINVQVEPTESPGELRVSWLPPLKETHNGIVMGYHVRAVPQNTGAVSDDADSRTVKVTPLTGKQETILGGLLKNIRYAVSVSAYTSAGSGPYSLPVFQDTREGAPEQAPSSVECTAVSSTSLRVGWQPIVLPGQGSSLVGYTVLYATEEGAWMNQTSLHTELYLQSLLKYSNYTVKVAGFSNFGVGPFSYPIVCATLQDVPGPPSDTKVLVLSSTSLLISWKRPEHPNGEILHYTIYVKPTSSAGIAQPHRAGSTRTSAELGALTSGVTYETWVTASTAAGEGSASRRVSHTPSSRVVAGVASLGGTISVGVGSSLLLVCQCVGVPPPRTVWYHKHNIITHHPRFTRNHDDSLLINNIDQSLSGNYTCLAKNLYGSDSVEYSVVVLPLPEAPLLRATPYKDSVLVEWEQPYYSANGSSSQKISYSLTWKESNGPWQEAWPTNKLPNLSGVQKHALTGLKCGTKYSLRITATNRVGTSQPAYMDVSTVGGVPISPSSNEWFWSNSSHIYVQLAGWDDGGCELRSWEVEYRVLGTRGWIRAHDTVKLYNEPSWSMPLYHAKYRTGSFAIAELLPGTWYQVRVTAVNEAGSTTTQYSFATKNEDGSEVGPPSEFFDLNMLVIVCSSILLTICLLSCVYILVKRQRSGNLTEYRDSITADNKSESGVLTANTSHTNLANAKDGAINAQNRIYSAPIHMRNNSKHELYEISPYAQFAVGFRTFGHVENQDLPTRLHKQRYDTETSFQVCSESEDSDSISKSTMKSVPRSNRSKQYKEVCRTPHHR